VLADNQADIPIQEWVFKSRQGDTEAFRHIYRHYQQRVRATLYQLCGQTMLDDLVQEVFLRVWRGLPKLRNSEQFGTWLYRLTWNVAMDERRQLGKQPVRDWDSPAKQEQFWDSFPATEATTPNLLRLHYQDVLQQGLQSLSLEHRAVLILHDLEDLPQKEIAHILQIPLGTVKSRLYYARHTLKQFLQNQGVF
jgi:RNA polymerase sigma-70 factor (ECF subfamily)